LIAKRSMDKKIFPGAWENIGGRLEGEETLDECVEREVFEEIGCSPLWLKQIKTKISKYESKKYLNVLYVGEIEKIGKINRKEVEQLKWISYGEKETFHFFPGNDEAVDLAFGYMENLT